MKLIHWKRVYKTRRHLFCFKLILQHYFACQAQPQGAKHGERFFYRKKVIYNDSDNYVKLL
jgi:hypothetical protein